MKVQTRGMKLDDEETKQPLISKQINKDQDIKMLFFILLCPLQALFSVVESPTQQLLGSVSNNVKLVTFWV